MTCGVNIPYMDVMGWDVLCVFEMKKTRGK